MSCGPGRERAHTHKCTHAQIQTQTQTQVGREIGLSSPPYVHFEIVPGCQDAAGVLRRDDRRGAVDVPKHGVQRLDGDLPKP